MIDGYILPILAHVGGSVLGILPGAVLLGTVFTALHWLAEPCNPGMPWWRKPGLVTDFVFMFALPLLGGWVRVFFLVFGALFVYRISPDRLDDFFAGGHGPLAGLSFWVQLPIYLLLADFMMYWTHRLFHGASLWRYHAIHHAPEHLDWTSATRFHPLNIFFHSVLADAVLLLLGISPAVLIFLGPFNVAMSAFVHANLDWTLGPFRYVIAGPVFHRWHHTDPERGGDKNFAPTFPVLDLIFGTFHMPAGERPDRYGVDDANFPTGLAAQMLYPFRKPDGSGSPEPQAVSPVTAG
ncbi:MAG: sterol desaturase family protein [Enterovirga sp.]|jgi:sterol desaturase/sphingolipid hydroxylase (fatty acid hydroxylase superfamily)|nr:sterol desaturase family protein [Enterovirga sp.]